jgi:hypothetical protein
MTEEFVDRIQFLPSVNVVKLILFYGKQVYVGASVHIGIPCYST